MNGYDLDLVLPDLRNLPDLSLGDEGGTRLGEADHEGFVQGSHRPSAHDIVDVEPLLIRDHGEVFDVILSRLAGSLQNPVVLSNQPVLFHLVDDSFQLIECQIPEGVGSA